MADREWWSKAEVRSSSSRLEVGGGAGESNVWFLKVECMVPEEFNVWFLKVECMVPEGRMYGF